MNVMNVNDVPAALPSDASIAQLVGQVYESAPPVERCRLLRQLLRPLGLLSLVVVANGIFANIRLHSDWPDMHMQPEDAQNVRANDVITLVNYVQQVNVQAVDGLADTLKASSVMASSAAAGLLVTLLLQRSQTHHASD
jgi:hypothetical protein